MEVDNESTFSNSSTISSIAPSGQPRNEDTFRILIATDVHLGVHEKDPIRADDSFNTFEEILQTGKKQNVDFILLGGDLFHDSKPSQSCYVKAISLIRENTMGDKPIDVAFVSDKDIFQNSVIDDVNYQDPNQNVSYPIFSIHGNHDDPSGFGRTSALDVLSATGQLNYFGVCKDLTNIKLKPILLRKGKSKLAIYGISHIRDERLSRLMAAGSVKYEQPPSNPESWFKILVLHQNRVPRPGTKHIEDKWIPDFIDLVIWGHEHDCLITPQKSMDPDKEFFIIQPGSPVATSLCEGEAVEKKIGVLKVFAKKFHLDEIKLETVRPFIFHTESTKNWNFASKRNQTKEFEDLTRKFIKTRLLPLAEKMLTGHPKQPTLPLIRLRLELEDKSHQFNPIRFGQQHFNNIVANIGDVIIFKTAFANRAGRKDNVLIDAADLEDLLDTTEMKAETLAPQFFEHEENQHRTLKVLGIVGMCEAVTSFIEKDDKTALNAMINHQVHKTLEFLKDQKDLSDDKTVIQSLIGRFKDMRSSATQEEEVESARKYLEGDSRLDVTDVLIDRGAINAVASQIQSSGSAVDDNDDDFGPATSIASTTRGKGRGRGGRGRGRGQSSRASNASSRASNASRASSAKSVVDHTMSDDDDDDTSVVLETTKTAKTRGRGNASSSFRASGRSSAASKANGNGTVLNFFTRKTVANPEPDDDFFGNIQSAPPAKKKKIMYVDDDSD
uniref:Double-strand break repair protein n=1 Tax=Lygus hesperus TaxID=30085 RepID=A0A146MDQ8_LYGHE